jgi:hemerythrin superfamily protein
MRTLADQDVPELGGRFSVLARQKADHVRLDALLHELADRPAEQQDDVLRRVYRLVFPHAFAEESVLWPAIRRRLPEGAALTLRIEQEHQQVNELVTALEGLGADDPRRPPTVRRLVEVLREDVRDEEDELLPRLQACTSTAALRRLGLAWELVRRVAPTRAHPVVARRPLGNVVAALPLTVVDRLRDRVDHVRLDEVAGPRRQQLSRALTRLAHRIEHLPPLTRGEDPTTARR